MKHVHDLEIKINSGTTVYKSNITPLEAMLLTAEHHKNVGGAVFDAADADKRAHDVADQTYDAEGKPVVKDGKPVTAARTDDQEIGRLKVKYGPHKVKAIVSDMRTFPATFKEAAEKGLQVVLPSSPLSQTKLV